MIISSEDYDAVCSEEYLEHFGIKGMKWGRRKAKPQRTPSQELERQHKINIAKNAGKMIGGSAAVIAGMVATQRLMRKAIIKSPLGQRGGMGPGLGAVALSYAGSSAIGIAGGHYIGKILTSESKKSKRIRREYQQMRTQQRKKKYIA